MPRIKTGGRKKGTKNRAIKGSIKKYLPREISLTISEMDRSGRSMAEIQIDAARYLETVAIAERSKPGSLIENCTKYAAMAAKVAHDVSPYLYPALQSIKHGGDENAAPIRMESLSEFQLETLIKRLRRG